jgi:hypothetical protein
MYVLGDDISVMRSVNVIDTEASSPRQYGMWLHLAIEREPYRCCSPSGSVGRLRDYCWLSREVCAVV